MSVIEKGKIYSFEEAKAILGKITTESDLRLLVEQMDTRVDGNVTILYSGQMPNGVRAYKYAESVKNIPGIRAVSKSEGAKLLNSKKIHYYYQ